MAKRVLSVFHIAFWAFLAAFFSSSSHAASLSIQWDHSPDPLTNYTVWYGPRGETDRSKFSRIDVGDATTATISDLIESLFYQIYVVGTDATGAESLPSNTLFYPIGSGPEDPPPVDPPPVEPPPPPPNRPPSFEAGQTEHVADSERSLSFRISAVDPDSGQSLTYSLDASAPPGAAINPSSGRVTWTPKEGQAAKSYAVKVGSSRVDLQACKLEYSIVSPK